MLTSDQIAQINVNLGLCDTYLLNTSEINLLDAVGVDPVSVCDFWATTQEVLNSRAKTDTTMQQSLEVLLVLSSLDSCTIALQPEPVPDVNIPYFGGGL